MKNQPYSNQKGNSQKNTNQQSENVLGLDIDEQEMNGLYGMAQTNTEDQNNSENS